MAKDQAAVRDMNTITDFDQGSMADIHFHLVADKNIFPDLASHNAPELWPEEAIIERGEKYGIHAVFQEDAVTEAPECPLKGAPGADPAIFSFGEIQSGFFQDPVGGTCFLFHR
jgi:hypothetical protein